MEKRFVFRFSFFWFKKRKWKNESFFLYSIKFSSCEMQLWNSTRTQKSVIFSFIISEIRNKIQYYTSLRINWTSLVCTGYINSESVPGSLPTLPGRDCLPAVTLTLGPWTFSVDVTMVCSRTWSTEGTVASPFPRALMNSMIMAMD